MTINAMPVESAVFMNARDVTDAMLAVFDMGNPITTRYVGTIAFQGTDAQINEAMQRYFGERK